MKKISIIALLTFLILGINTECKAASCRENLENAAEFTEIKELEAGILSHTETFLDLEGIKYTELFLNYEKAAKIYIDVEISDAVTKESEIKSFLEKADYVWVIPVEGLEEGQKEHVKITISQAQEGTWKESETALTYLEPYVTQMEKHESVMDSYVFVGGMKGLHYPVAIGFKDGEAQYWGSLGHDYNAFQAYEAEIRKKDGLYDYQSGKQVIDEYTNREMKEQIEGNVGYYALAAIAVVMVSIIGGSWYVLKKRGKL